MSASLDRALILLQQSRPELAEKELRGALADQPDNPVGHAFLALCLLDLERLSEATVEAEEAVRLAPDMDLAHYALARALLARDRLSEAEGAINEAIRLDPNDAEYCHLLGAIRFDRRRWSEALEAAERGLAIDAEHAGCNNLRAMALVKLGRRREAGLTIEETLARNPDDAITHANQGWALLDASDPGRAQHHFREALRLDPELEWARAGIVESLKARNFLYRLMLRYFLWMAKLSGKAQWAVLLGFVFGRQILVSIGRSNPAIAPFVGLLVILLFIFLVLTWIAVPLFNLLLRLDPFGRLALSREQVVASNWLGACLLATLASFVAFLATRDPRGWIGAVDFFFLLLPLAGMFQSPAGWPRTVMTLVTVALAIAGPGMLALTFVVPAGSNAYDTVAGIHRQYLLGVILSTWASVFLAQARPRR